MRHEILIVGSQDFALFASPLVNGDSELSEAIRKELNKEILLAGQEVVTKGTSQRQDKCEVEHR